MNQPPYTPLDHWEAWANKTQPAQQEPLDHKAAARLALRDAQRRSYEVARTTHHQAREPEQSAQQEPVYTIPQPPAQRKPLTRSQINQMMSDAGWQNSAIRQADLDKVEKVARAIEVAHGIKD